MRALRTLPLVALLAVAGVANAQLNMRPSKSDQVKLGKQAAQEIRQKERVLPSNHEKVRTLRRVGSRLLATISDGKDPWEYSFDVIENKQLNAFALPGGPVFFYTGLMDKMQYEDELAAVLAHEIVHVRKEHWAAQYARQQERNLLLNLGLILTRSNRTTAGLAGLGVDVIANLPMSRGAETESDSIGMDMMIKAGYSPEGMVRVFDMLRKQSSGGKPPEWLSTHPNDSNRIKNLDARIDKMNRSFPSMRPLPW